MDKEAILSALERVLANADFQRSDRASAFLRYVVDEDLSGRADQLNGITIAQDVFGRDETFDPNTDPIVRVQAGRVRSMLDIYYAGAGAQDPVRISIPKGGYAPEYTALADIAAAGAEARNGLTSPAPHKDVSRDTSGDPGRLLWKQTLNNPPFVILSLLLCALIAVCLYRFSPPSAEGGGAVDKGPRIYVSRFSYSGAPELEDSFKTGFQIELTDRLSRFKEIYVYSPDAPYDGRRGFGDLQVKAQKGSPAFVLFGTIAHLGDHLAITSQLIDSASASVIWSHSYANVIAAPDNVAQTMSSIASDVAAALGQPYGVIHSHLDKTVPGIEDITFSDYVCVLRFYSYARHKTAQAHGEVRDCLETVVDRSPDYATGWAALSWMYGDEERYGFNTRPGVPSPAKRSLAAAEKAVSVDPYNAMAHEYLAIAHFLNDNPSGFHSALKVSLQLNPNDSEALASFGWSEIVLGNTDAGKTMVERAIAINPGHPPWFHGGLILYYYQTQAFDKAYAHAQQYLEEGSALALALAAATSLHIGRETEAANTWVRLQTSFPDDANDLRRLFRSWQFSEGLTSQLLTDLDRAARYSREAM